MVLSIAVASIGLASASDMNDTYITDSDFNVESLDVDSSYDSLSSDLDDEVDEDTGASSQEALQVPDGYVPEDEEQESSEGSAADKQNNETPVIIGPTIPVCDIGNSSKTPKFGPYVENDTNKIVVTVNTPGTFEELQLLIDNAKDGSTLYLTRDYNGHKDARITINKNLIINGLGYSINCLGAENCFAFYSIWGDVTLKNLNIINGRNDMNQKGGAIDIGGFATYIIKDCNFINNWADDYGGAICNDAGSPLKIINCLFSGNTADDNDGGAIFSNGELYIENSTFGFNKAYVDGGAIKATKNVNVYNSIFNSNVAKGANSQCYGGAICSKEDVNIWGCTFSGNVAADYGGAVYAKNINVNKPASIVDYILNRTEKYINTSGLKTYFIGNQASDNDGGALYAEENVVLYNANLTRNHAYEDGGAVFCKKAYAYDSSFEHNEAKGAKCAQCEGGAIFATDKTYLHACIFLWNFADTTGGAIFTYELDTSDEKCIFDNNKKGNGYSCYSSWDQVKNTFYFKDIDVHISNYFHFEKLFD